MAKITNDKYYTPDNVVKKVIEVLEKDVMPIEKFTRIIEPSAGAGAFLNHLPAETIAYDIEPHNQKIIKGNYLKQNISYKKNSLVIGNPPFSTENNNSFYKTFITRSLEHSDYVAFILPIGTFQKNNIKNGVLLKSYRLPTIKFSGKEIGCCFNIYKKGVPQKKKIKNIEFYKYVRVKKNKDFILKEKEWQKLKADIRIKSWGTVRILKMNDPKVKVDEIKIINNSKVPTEKIKKMIEIFTKNKEKRKAGASRVVIQEIIDLIWEYFPELRIE